MLAVGTRPFRPDYVPFDGERVLDSDEIIDLKFLPKSLAVIGAGVIGVEYASIFNALDVQVTLVEKRGLDSLGLGTDQVRNGRTVARNSVGRSAWT